MLLDKQSFGQSLLNGVWDGLIGGASGGLIGGIGGGIGAVKSGNDFWDGDIPLQERLDIIKQKNAGRMSETKVTDIKIGKNMPDANGQAIPGRKRVLLSDGYLGIEDNTIELSKRTVRRIWRGKMTGIQTLDHEFVHTRDFSSGFYDRITKSYSSYPNGGSNYVNAVMEFRAYLSSYLNTGNSGYGREVLKQYNIFKSTFY